MKVHFEMPVIAPPGKMPKNLRRDMVLDFPVTPGMWMEVAPGWCGVEIAATFLRHDATLTARLKLLQLEEADHVDELLAAGWTR